MNIDFLENNSILIIPNNLKENVLKKLSSKLLNIKIMNIEEFKKKYYFDYNTETLFYIINNFNVSYDFATEIIENLYYIEDKEYKENKINFLVNIKRELINNNLLIFDKLFNQYIEFKKIYIYGYDYIQKFYKKMFSNLNVIYIDKEQKNYNHPILEFEYMDDEIIYCANKICELIDNNVPINKIKIANINSDYTTSLKRIFKTYNIPININTNYLYSTVTAQKFLDNLGSNIEETLNNLKNSININDDLVLNEFNQIVSICNKYNWQDDFSVLKHMIIEELKVTKIQVKKIHNAIEFVSLHDNIFDDEYVFILGFNQNIYPKTLKDDEYINDSIKNTFNLETTSLKNEIIYNSLVNNISSIKNLFISYKLKNQFNTFYPSQIIDDYHLEVIKPKLSHIDFSYLEKRIELAINLDDYFKYGIITDNLKILYNSLPSTEYKTYDNQYKKIDDHNFQKYVKNKLSLSYTSINNFFKCGFRFYAENILKLNNYQSTFSIFIGNLFHYILSIMYDDNFNFENSYNGYIEKNYEINSNKEKFFLEKLKNELVFIIEVIKNQDEYIGLDNRMFEENIKINFNIKNFEIVFKGIIDKLLYKKIDNKTLIAIIDYKTGNPNLNLNNIIYGIDMQLCIYAYLSTKIKYFANAELVGIYLQKVLNNEVNRQKNKNYIDLKKDNLKLQGYSINDYNLIKNFDKTYQDSNLIKSLKVGKNGFYAYSKIFDKDVIQNILNLVNDKIYLVSNKIIDREFEINPKKIGIKNLISCEHCNYKEICYMTEENIINLKEYKNLEFLKGDQNEMD